MTDVTQLQTDLAAAQAQVTDLTTALGILNAANVQLQAGVSRAVYAKMHTDLAEMSGDLNSELASVRAEVAAIEAQIAADTPPTPVPTPTPTPTPTPIPVTGFTPLAPADVLSQLASTPSFSDAFVGTTLDSSKWNNTYQGRGGGVVGVNSTSAGAVAVDNGVTVSLLSDTVGGCIDTHGKFNFTEGLLQVVQTLPGDATGVYNWGGAYVASYQEGQDLTEVDLDETLNQVGSANNSLNASPRTSVHGTDDAMEFSKSPPGEYAGVEVTYGFLHSGDTVTFFINGAEVESYSNAEAGGTNALEIYICEGQSEEYAGKTVIGAGIKTAQVAFWPLAA